MKNNVKQFKSLVAIIALTGAMGAMGANDGELSTGDWRYVGGERGWSFAPALRDGRSRADVLQELADFRKNPVSGAWRYMEGEPGWIPEPGSGEGKTRAEVLKELDAFNRNPVARARAADLYGTP